MRVGRSVPCRRVRSFVAVDVGGEVRGALRPVVGALRARLPALRWVAEANWHLTVKFLGDVELLQLGDIGKAVQEEAGRAPVFELALAGLTAFPPGRRPRVLAAKVSAGAEQLAELHRRLDQRLGDFGVPLENRPFHAHLTLARVGEGRTGEGVFEELTPAGPLYTPLCTAKLGQL
jgi:2'-5' RNA ligase